MSRPERDVDALRPIYDAWGRGDWSAGPEVYGAEMVWSWSDEFPDIGGVYEHPEDSERALREWLAGWENWRCEAEEFLPTESGRGLHPVSRYRTRWNRARQACRARLDDARRQGGPARRVHRPRAGAAKRRTPRPRLESDRGWL